MVTYDKIISHFSSLINIIKWFDWLPLVIIWLSDEQQSESFFFVLIEYCLLSKIYVIKSDGGLPFVIKLSRFAFTMRLPRSRFVVIRDGPAVCWHGGGFQSCSYTRAQHWILADNFPGNVAGELHQWRARESIALDLLSVRWGRLVDYF